MNNFETYQPQLVRRSDLVSFFIGVFITLLFIALAMFSWSENTFFSAGVIRAIVFCISVIIAGMSGLWTILGGVAHFPYRRRVIRLATILSKINCPNCSTLYAAEIVDSYAVEVSPMCSGDPANENLQSRWQISCGQCGAIVHYDDDGQPVVGGIMPVFVRQ